MATDAENIGKSRKWFEAGPPPGSRDCTVPGVLQRTFPGYNGVVWYWKSFPAPVVPSGQRFRLNFAAADYMTEVWLNGQYIGMHEGGETPFSFDITTRLRVGMENQLVVRLLNPGPERIDGIVLDEVPHGIKHVPMRVGNFWNPGGLWQDVELLRVPPVRIGDAFVTTKRANRSIQTRVTIANETAESVPGSLVLELSDGDGRVAIHRQSESIAIPAGGASIDMTSQLDKIHDWSPDDPHLYRLTIHLEAAGAADNYSTRTAFREFEFSNGYFRLNGRRIFLKGTHSVGHFPIGQHVPSNPELLRRELVLVKAMGFNTVRWLGRTMFPSQLELCDELGLMVYEESYASWNWKDSPEMKRRFDLSVREMLLRDRNHPSVVIWGLLNETVANPIFWHATEMLPLIRGLDPSRLVMLSSGRWDGQWQIGSLANPGVNTWQAVLGSEGAGAVAVKQRHPNGYTEGAGDLHMYLPRPWGADDLRFYRTVGTGTKNVFLSEYGNGSQIDPIRILKLMQQEGAEPSLEDYRLYSEMSGQLDRDWKSWGLNRIFASPSDMILAGEKLQSDQRLISLNAIRSNPHLAGYSLTGLSDQAIEGEGLMTTFRELKPGVVKAITDGLSPVRWCVFAKPVHLYRGGTVHVEAVLANEDALLPGPYTARMKVVGPEGPVFEKTVEVNISDPRSTPEPPMVLPAFAEDVKLSGAPGRYQVEVSFDKGIAAVGRASLITGERNTIPTIRTVAPVVASEALSNWLAKHVIQPTQGTGSAVVIVSSGETAGADLMEQVKKGSVAILLEPSKLPGSLPGEVVNSAPQFWGRDDIVKPHPVFDSLPSRGLMDLFFYRDLIARSSIVDIGQDAENIVPAFAVGRPGGQGYWAGSNLAIYKYGAGEVIVSTLRLVENLDQHPAADRILSNLVAFAAKAVEGSKRTVMVPMRDGVKLATDVYLEDRGDKQPVLVMRTPYNKSAVRITAEKYAAAGYTVVVQDTRGRYESEGTFVPYNNEGQDGYDTMDWISRQPWSGKGVGMWGASYVGAVQWQAVAEHAPGLAVLAPTATWSSFYRNVYLGGAVRLGLIAQAAAGLEPAPVGTKPAEINWSKVLLHLPLSTLDMAIGWHMPWLTSILTHPQADGFWKRLDITAEVAQVDLPTQHIAGYYDFFCREVVANFQRRKGAAKQLILGPWDHGTIGKTRVGDVDFGPNATLDLAAENLVWFDRFLKHQAGTFPPVRYFSMGENQWYRADSWPPSNTREAVFYMHSDGNANSRRGTGRLSREAPGREPADVFVSDPADPVPAVPTAKGRQAYEAVWGPVNQGPSEDRKDVLVYSTEALTHAIRFAGPLRADLRVNADTPSSDWVVKVEDVGPDNFVHCLAVGIQRTAPSAHDDRIQVDLGHAAALIGAGHQLRVEVTGSYFPLFDRNTNTGEGPFSARTMLARQTLKHSVDTPSRVLIPLMETGQ